jgi:hypothetical protein
MFATPPRSEELPDVGVPVGAFPNKFPLITPVAVLIVPVVGAVEAAAFLALASASAACLLGVGPKTFLPAESTTV